MKKFYAALLAAMMTLGVMLTATDASADHRHRGRNAAVGIIAGAAALAIIANSNRAHASDYDDGDEEHHHHRRVYRYIEDDGEGQCRRWRHRCNEGSDWSCEKFERNC